MSLAGAGPCDRGLARTAPEGGATHQPRGTLAATILGSSLAFIDSSVVNVGLPAIERDLASSGASGDLLGFILAGDASAPGLISRFHGAAIVGALLALGAAAAAFALVASGSPDPHAPAPTAAP